MALLITFLILLQTAFLSPLCAMDLMEAYTRAKDNDPLFGAAFYENEAAGTLSRQGLSFLLPQVQMSGAFSRYYFNNPPAGYLDYDARTLGVNLRQTILDLRKVHEYRQYKIRETLGDMKFAAAEQNLILRVAEAYFNALAAGNLVELIAAEKEAVIELREQATRMFQAGVATLVDLHDAQARYDAVLSRAVEAQNNLDNKMEALKRIVGCDPGRLNFLKGEIPLGVPEPNHIEGWIEKAKKEHPLLKSYLYQIAVREEEVEKNKGQHWPTLDLVAGYNITNTNNYLRTDELSYGNVGVQLNIPLFGGGYVSAKVMESQANVRQARKEYESALSEIVQKLSEAFLGIRGSIARIDALSTANRSASTSVHSNKMGLTAGVRTTTDILNAQRELQDVRARLFQARYDYLLNIVRLKSAAGVLSGDDLRMINEWLQDGSAR